MPAVQVREVRYVRTSALTRVLDPLDQRTIAALIADRSGQFESTGATPLPYLRISEKGIRTLLVDFNSVRDGPMDKAALIAAVQQAFKEAVVQELDLFMPEAFSSMVADRVVAESVDKVDIRKTRFVMHLVHYPCRRDGVKNKFWADIQSYMTDDEKTWMEPASLNYRIFCSVRGFQGPHPEEGACGRGVAEEDQGVAGQHRKPAGPCSRWFHPTLSRP